MVTHALDERRVFEHGPSNYVRIEWAEPTWNNNVAPNIDRPKKEQTADIARWELHQDGNIKTFHEENFYFRFASFSFFDC